jgi:hypothetical protein
VADGVARAAGQGVGGVEDALGVGRDPGLEAGAAGDGEDRVGDLLGLAGAHAAGGLHAGTELGGDHRREDDRDVHAVGGQLGGHRLGEADHAELAGGVDRAAGHADPTDGRGDVDDVAVAALEHGAGGELGAGDDGAQVDVEDLVDRLLGLLHERGERHDPGVVDQDLDRAERLGPGQERGEGAAVGDVDHEALGAAADLGRGLGGHVVVEVADDHAGPGVGEPPGGGQADAAAGAGDGDDLPAQVAVGRAGQAGPAGGGAAGAHGRSPRG